ncbi:MAG: gamma-glutamylcyclotransferase, partial [Actinobacteria bacterium]|nr:gamma-glutamylcyclotransferase [Actinomycetota bacterium]
MFFYGTLKRGHANHDLFCRGYLRVEEATVRGRLYDLPSGYPALVVPEEDVHATGTADPLEDASEQQLGHARVH